MEPKVLKIGIHKYTISEEMLDGEECSQKWGGTTWDEGTIEIHKPLREINKRLALLHEVLHVIFMHTGIQQDEAERLCNEMEYPLLEILTKNEGVIKYIGGYK